jgi:predicted nucleic acid-binding protein
MKDYVLDANAVLRYFGIGHAQGGETLRGLFEQAERNQARLLMSVINMGEVLYILLKSLDEPSALQHVHALQHVVTMIDADGDRALEAATLKHRCNLGYADSFAAALALASKATLVSADPAFAKVGRSLRWMRLPKPNGKTR